MEPAVNLDIRLGHGDSTKYVAYVEIDDPRASKQSEFELPLGDDEVVALDRLLQIERARGFPAGEAAPAAPPAEEELQRLGARLFGAVFSGAAENVLVRAEMHYRERRRTLRLCFKADGVPELARLPWELMYSEEWSYPVTNERFSVVRVGDVSVDADRPALSGPLRVLVVAASPVDRPALAVDEEYAKLEAALQGAVAESRIVLQRLDEPTKDALRSALAARDDEAWHVLHFIGHGDVGERGGVVELCEPGTGRADPMSGDDLAMATGQATALRLVVLNGCHTSTDPFQRPLSGVAPMLVQHHVPAVVAMQFPISDDQAVRFAAEFYRELAASGVIDRAVARGRVALMNRAEWMTPVLHLRSDGQLFDIVTDPSTSVLAAGPAARVPAGLVPAAMVERAWLVDAVDTWRRDGRGHLLLVGDLGTGKTTMAARLAGQGPAPAAGSAMADVQASWRAALFCSATTQGATTDARAFVVGLVEQLSSTVEGFAGAIGTDAATLLYGGAPVDELFGRTVDLPLRRVLAEPGVAEVAVLVDGLDEGAGAPRPTIADLVARLGQIDGRIRLLVTTAPDADVVARWHEGGAAMLDLGGEEHRARVAGDLREFINARLAGPGDAAGVLTATIRAADGNFLYAEHRVGQLCATEPAHWAELTLPADLGDSYRRQLRRLVEREYGEGWRERWVGELQPLLAPLSVAFEPVPAALLERLLGWTKPHLYEVLHRFSELVPPPPDDCVAIYHPAVAAFLLDPGGDEAGLFRTDRRAAHRAFVDTALAMAGSDGAFRDADLHGGAYGLVHLAGHAAAVAGPGRDDGDDGVDGGLIARVAAVVLTAPYVAALRRVVTDPVRVGRPFRDLARALLARGRFADVSSLVRFVAASGDPAVRGVAFDILLDFTAADRAAAADLIVDLSCGADDEVAAVAMHAASGLPAADQVALFSRIVDGASKERRQAAASALYASSLSGDRAVLDQVLDELLAGLSPFRRPQSLIPRLAFITDVTVTNYINHCDDPRVTWATSERCRTLLVDRLHADSRALRLIEPLVERVAAGRVAERVLDVISDGEAPFETDPGTREAATRVLAALDPAEPLAPLTADLATLLDGDANTLRVLAAQILAVHGIAEPSTAATVARELFADGDRRRRSLVVAAHAVVMAGTPAAWVDLLEPLTSELTASSGAAPEGVPDTIFRGLDLVAVPLALAYAKSGRPMSFFEETVSTFDPGPVRAQCLQGLAVAGLFQLDAVLEAFDRLADRGAEPGELAAAVSLTAGLHPLRCRLWAERTLEERDAVQPDLAAARRHLEVLGMYNNAVHQAVNHPIMREQISRPVYELFLDSPSRKEWARRYTRQGLTMFKDAHFEPIRWTTLWPGSPPG